MRIDIKAMELADLEEILTIENVSFPTPWSRSAFIAELFDNARACYLTARVGHRIAGYVGAWLVVDEGHITNIAVHPDFRRRGIGEKLLRAIIDCCKSRGAKRMTLEVRVSNVNAQKLYEKVGFAGAGLRRRYYRDNNEDALIMWKEVLVPQAPGWESG